MTGAPLPSVEPIEVGLDTSHRVVSVHVARLPDELREPVQLAAAFRDAVARAIAADLPPAPLPLDDAGRVHAARVTAPPRRPLRELVEEAARRPRTEPHRSASPPLGGERGMSDNGCVTAVLDPSGPGGDLGFDRGWLSQATTSRVAAAIMQAFTAAYHEREAR
jgi:hypothetical protein